VTFGVTNIVQERETCRNKSELLPGSITYDMIYLLTAIVLPSSGISTVNIYTQTIHRTTQNKKYIEQHQNFGRLQSVPRLCELYPGICLTTEEKTQRNLSQGSRRVPADTMKIHNLCKACIITFLA
jgi:hypothetical protein